MIQGLYLLKSNNKEAEITPELVSLLTPEDKNTYIGLHIAPKTLVNSGNDYYIKIEELTTEKTLAKVKRWTDNYIDLPNVSNNTKTEYRGKLMTQNMIEDCLRSGMNITSPAAEYANSLVWNGMKGFIGTRAQINYIMNTYYKTNIYSILEKLGYVVNFDSTNIWSSSQDSATLSWYWNSSGGWYSFNKILSYLVLPFFAI